MREVQKILDKTISKKIKMEYLVILPDGYNQDEESRYPLLLFLHGSGERGDDLERVKDYGLPDILSNPGLPFIILAPLCPKETVWSYKLDSLKAVLDEVTDSYPIDSSRIYLTGLSMGGYGTWDLGMKYPGFFAAIAPICGGTFLDENIGKLVSTPVWAFHGEDDQSVPVNETRKLVDKLELLGGNAKATYYPDTGHYSWAKAYRTSELYEWMLSHSRTE